MTGSGGAHQTVILSVGLTGGIASGKSTVLRHLGRLGCVVHDADAIVADLYRQGAAGHRAIVEAYGREMLLASGEIDRKALAAMAFSSPRQSAKLNELIHPLVIGRQMELLEGARRSGPDGIWVFEATLLLESGGRARFDRIVVVEVPVRTQLDRAAARGLPRDETARRIAHQMTADERRVHADYVIDNSGSEEDLERETLRVHRALQSDLAARSRIRVSPKAPYQ